MNSHHNQSVIQEGRKHVCDSKREIKKLVKRVCVAVETRREKARERERGRDRKEEEEREEGCEREERKKSSRRGRGKKTKRDIRKEIQSSRHRLSESLE